MDIYRETVTDATAVLLAPKNVQRDYVILNASEDIVVGTDNTVTAATGHLQYAGIPQYYTEKGEIWVISVSGDAEVSGADIKPADLQTPG